MLRVQAAHLSHSLLSCWDDQRSAGSDSGLLLPLLSRWKGQPSLKGVYARGTLIRHFAPASGRLQGTPWEARILPRLWNVLPVFPNHP